MQRGSPTIGQQWRQQFEPTRPNQTRTKQYSTVFIAILSVIAL